MNRVRELLTNNYCVRADNLYNQTVKLIENMDLNREFYNSLEEGYAGFEIINDPFFGAMTYEQRESLVDLIQNRLRCCQLNDVTRVFLHDTSLGITVNGDFLTGRYLLTVRRYAR